MRCCSLWGNCACCVKGLSWSPSSCSACSGIGCTPWDVTDSPDNRCCSHIVVHYDPSLMSTSCTAIFAGDNRLCLYAYTMAKQAAADWDLYLTTAKLYSVHISLARPQEGRTMVAGEEWLLPAARCMSYLSASSYPCQLSQLITPAAS